TMPWNKHSSNTPLAHTYILAANILYGLNYVIAKVALQVIPAFGLVLTRVTIPLVLFYIFHKIFIREKVDRKDHFLLFLCGLFGVAANQLMFIKGLSLTSEIHASLLMITTPILVMVASWFVLKETVTWRKIIGIIIGGFGVYLLVQGGTNETQSTSTVSGDLLIVGNAAVYAIFLVIAKPLMQKYSPFTIALWIFFYGWFIVFPFGIREFLSVDWMHLDTPIFSAWLYVVFGATLLAYVFNVLGLKYGTPTLVSIYIYTQPVIATVVAVILGTDILTLPKVIASLCIFTGVAIVSFEIGKTFLKKTTVTRKINN
ncbi:MAG: DMT family transporter, partial [Chitinophagales bacterium]|nr:DMT family transporter [Chitinophagales bacterium]